MYLSIFLLYLWVGFCAFWLFVLALILAIVRHIQKKRGKKTRVFTALIVASLVVAIPWGSYFVSVPAYYISNAIAEKKFDYDAVGNAVANAIKAHDAAALEDMTRKDLRRSVRGLTGEINALLGVMQGEILDCTLQEQSRNPNGDQNFRGVGLQATTTVTEYYIGVRYCIRGGVGIDSLWIFTSDADYRPQAKYEIPPEKPESQKDRASRFRNTDAVKLVAEDSWFDDFRVVGDVVFFDCAVTLQNTSDQPHAVQIAALADHADCFGLVTGNSDSQWVTCYDAVTGAMEFVIPAAANAIFQITFEEPYGGTPVKANRLLPVLRLFDAP
jgi:hypothetical protein